MIILFYCKPCTCFGRTSHNYTLANKANLNLQTQFSVLPFYRKFSTKLNEHQNGINIVTESAKPDERIHVPKVNYRGWDVCLHCGDLAAELKVSDMQLYR